MTILQGAVYYTFVTKPDNFKGKEFYKTSLVLEGEELAKAKKLGVPLKEDKSGKIPGQYVLLKRNVLNRAGAKVDPVRVIDSKKNPWPKGVFIGNGTKANVKFSVIDRAGESPITYLEAIQIVDLVEYKSVGEDFDEEEGTDMSSYKSDEDDENFDEATGASKTTDDDFAE